MDAVAVLSDTVLECSDQLQDPGVQQKGLKSATVLFSLHGTKTTTSNVFLQVNARQLQQDTPERQLWMGGQERSIKEVGVQQKTVIEIVYVEIS